MDVLKEASVVNFISGLHTLSSIIINFIRFAPKIKVLASLWISMSMSIASLNAGVNFGKWFQDDVFIEMRKKLESVRRPLDVMELFGGLSTGYIALAALGCRPNIRCYCDSNSDLLHWISKVHNVDSPEIHCGRVSGDILEKEVAALPRVMIIIAGPPCPPWSTKGAYTE